MRFTASKISTRPRWFHRRGLASAFPILGLAALAAACSSTPSDEPGGAGASGGSGGSAGSAGKAAAGGTAGEPGATAGTSGRAGGGAGAGGSLGFAGGSQGGAPSGAGGGAGTPGGAGSGGTSVAAGSGGTPVAAGSGGAAGNSEAGSGGSAGTSGEAGGGGKSGGPGGAGGSGGAAGAGGSGNGGGQVFSSCRFHFGTIDSIAKNAGPNLISQLDFFTPGWMLGESFDQTYVCDETKAGGALEGKVPIVVAYLAAGIVKRRHGICDCNVTTCGSGNDLCRQGAALIKQNKQAILDAYRSYSQGYAGCYGTTKPIVFVMEPDFYQYTISEQTMPWTPSEAGQIMSEFVAALKTSLPNARFSIDASPWVAPNNGSDHGADWFSHFDMSLFTFVNTSGGGTNANTEKIRTNNNMTWAGLRQASGKPILADTGYGANGVSEGEDPNWNVAANINARIADGVISISQYNPGPSWGNTISSLRGQLTMPSACP